MIPYTLERRTDTGVSNTTLGIWLFLASEVMLFGALFSAYTLLRASAPAWPSGPATLNLPLGITNTLVLFAMTTMAWRARSGVACAEPSQGASDARRALAISSLFGLAFLAIKTFEYRGEIRAGLVPSTSTFLAIYFTLTGLHALHVIAGLIANGWVIAGRAGAAMLINRARLMSLYWAFVDVIWIAIFLVLYV